MEIIHTPAKKIAGKDLKACYAMTFKNDGDMAAWLYQARHYGYPVDAVLIKENDDLIGWGLRAPYGGVGIWVKRKHRRQGVGTLIVKELSKVGKIKVYPHDKTSELFFAKNRRLPAEYKLHYSVDKD